MGAEFFVGLDLGQSRSHAALAVVEQGAVLRLRHLERMARGTAYPEVVERVEEVVRSRALAGRKHVVVDATGVGRPVVDLLRRARLRCRLWAATITSGKRVTRGGGRYGAPKRELIEGVRELLRTGRLEIAAELEDMERLREEMLGMRVRRTAAGHEKYGARRGGHDDLVLAVALAGWGAGQGGEDGVRGGYRWVGME